ncbi:MAG: dihydroorotase [bacterium]
MKQIPNVHIRGGRLIDPANDIDQQTDLFLTDGLVESIGDKPEDFAADITIDAEGLIVCPGFIDLAVQMREPGLEHKATIASETRAAAAGGITTVVCTPDTAPVIDTPAVWELIRHAAKASGKVRVLAAGALTKDLKGSKLAEMVSLLDAGCVALSNGMVQLQDNLVTRQVMDYASTFDVPIWIRPEDRHLCAGGVMHEGAVSSRLGLPGIPTAAEAISVASHLALAEQTGAKVHFRGLSTANACQQLAQAQANNLPASADVAIHQLHLTEIDVDGFNAQCHVSPPLRTYEDREALRRALSNGTIRCICSDHQPHEADAKAQPFGETEAGISGLETLLPLSLKLVEDGVIDLVRMISALSVEPAQLIDLPLGQLAVGASADICIFDPDEVWQFRASDMHSAGKNSPFDGWEFTGKVQYTIFEGVPVYSAREAQ